MSIHTDHDTPTVALSTVGDLVRERAARARVFERHGIDYCCQGRRTLSEAADAAGLDLAGLAAEIAAVEPSPGDAASSLSTGALLDHLVAEHHAYLREELPALESLAAKVAAAHGSRHPELAGVERLVHALRDDIEPHLDDEETSVFPEVRRHLDGGAPVPADAIDRLRDDHEVVGALLAELRRTTWDYQVPADGCPSYQALYGRLADLEADTFRHVHLENNVLFDRLNG